jgi:hypothetical protein
VRVDISIDLMNHVMADKKIKDSDLDENLQNSKSYCIKTLWGIPRTFYNILKALNKMNKNTDIGYELPIDLGDADTEDDES